MAQVVDRLGDEDVEQVVDLVAGQRDQPGWRRVVGAFAGAAHCVVGLAVGIPIKSANLHDEPEVGPDGALWLGSTRIIPGSPPAKVAVLLIEGGIGAAIFARCNGLPADAGFEFTESDEGAYNALDGAPTLERAAAAARAILLSSWSQVEAIAGRLYRAGQWP